MEGVGGGRRQPSLAALGDGAVTVRIERGTRTIRKHIYDIFWKLKFDDDGLHHQDAAVSRRRSTPPTMHSRHFAINAFFRLIRRRCGNQRLTFAVRKRTTELSCEGMISILPGSGWIGA